MGDVQKALFAGGCFWCMQQTFDQVEGVLTTIVGYTGGTHPHPTYEEVSSGETDHVEAIEITYDPERVTYEKLVELYFQNIDPTDEGGQFVDRGRQYRPILFYHSEKEERCARSYIEKWTRSTGSSVKVALLPTTPFYAAETYHQKYYQKEPLRYQRYHDASGREKS